MSRYYVKRYLTLRHPTTLMIKKCVFEMLIVIAFLYQPHLPDSFVLEDGNECVSNEKIAIFAWINQVAFLGTLLYPI